MKTFLKKWNYLLITFICALVIIISVYILQKVSPFGGHSLLTIDFFHQYGPMLGELYNRIWHGSNLIYSFNMGMGLPFFRNFFNYLSSPFNIIILFFKHKDLLMSYSVVIGLKAIASAGTMCYYLNHKFKRNYLFIALSVLYAFSAYFTAYYWNIMWSDGLIMLPLIAYGIELLVNKNNIYVYIISLVIMLFANYFIGFMLCIFSVLYFVMYLIISSNKFNIKHILKKCLSFGLSSLIAGGLCSIFLIPMFFALRGISATSDIWPTSQYYDFTLIDFIFNHFSGVGSTVLKSGITTAPNISVGVLPVALLFIFIVNPKVKLKVKICYIAFLTLLFLSYKIAPLDFIWHAFHVPNDLPYRYSFIYSFILIVISAYSIDNLKSIKNIIVGIIYMMMLIFITAIKYSGYENISTDMIIMNYVIITIGFLSFIIWKYFKKYTSCAVIFVILTAGLECVMVVNNNWDIDQSISGFYEDYDGIKDTLEYVKNNDNEMYRIEKNDILTFNDPSWYDYYGQVTFSSMEYENMAILQNRLGMPGNEINSYYFKQNTPLYDMIFNIKYIIGNNKDNILYSIYYSNDTTSVYKNNYATGLMYGVSGDVKKWENNFINPFLNQNDFIKKATGVTDVLEEINYSGKIVYDQDGKQIVKYTFNNNDRNFYLYFNSPKIDFVIVNDNMYYTENDYNYINNIELHINSYLDYHERYIISDSSSDKLISFYVGYNDYNNDEINLYTTNEKKLNDAYKNIINKKVNIISFKENYIEAVTSNDSKTTIYTSIPYDIGWDLYIDGKKEDTFEIANTLLAFDIEAGDHDIVLKYHIPYIKIGSIISLLSFVGLIIIYKYKKEN